MAGEAYQVDYIINLQDNASAGIIKFSQAATKLANATKNFDAFQKRFNEMTATFNKQLELKISTSRASSKLNRIIKQLEKIHNLSTGINVGVAGSAGGGATNRRVSTTQVAAPAPRPTRVSQPQGPRPLVAPKGRQPLVPRNLEYQVLGPTRLGNVAMLDMFKGMGLMYGISAIGSGVRDILSQSTEYENIMQTAKNILKTNYKGGNFNASFADMERIVREVGVETKFTAPEVADAVKFFAMAGLDINAISKSIRPIADIALIGDTDLGQTADVMTNIMTAYGIKPDDMRKTADVMTRTFTMSNTTLLELAESFKMAGSMLHLANVPFETAAAAFGVLGDAGIKATMAGTTMRTIMNNLLNPTKNQMSYWQSLGIKRFDEYGNLREINDIFADLNKLNSKDERAAIAKQKYEELQKEIAPKLKGLEEGSAEYNKVLADFDYEKKSEAIRKQFGGVDVFRLFRLTAASGAGVLMNSGEKWNKIIEENFLSDGLSNKLAEQKKNTIAGMWAQLKSAFQEGGLKVFEENDGIIRGYLQKGISWLKSDDFTKMLRSVFDLVADLGGMLIRFTKTVVELYNKFQPLITNFLKFQLVLKGIQTIIGSFKQFGNTIFYAIAPIIRAASTIPVVQRRMTGFAGFSNAYLAAANNNNTIVASGGLSESMNPLLAWWAGRKWKRGMPEAPREPVLPVTSQPLPTNFKRTLNSISKYTPPAAPLGIGSPAMYNAQLPEWKRYQREMAAYNKRVKMANRMNNWGGISSMIGAGAGAFVGSTFAPDSEWASTIGGIAGMGLGAITPALTAAGPAGWIVLGIAGATVATAAVMKHIKAVNDVTKAADAYIATMGKFDVNALHVADISEYVAGRMQIENNVLLSQNDKLEVGIELWKKYYAAKKGDTELLDSTAGGYLYSNDSILSNLIDKRDGKKGKKFLSDAVYKFEESEIFKAAKQEDLIPSGYYSDNNDVAKILTLYAFNSNNKILTDAATFLSQKLPTAESIEDIQSIRKQFEQKFLTPKDGKMISIADEIKASTDNLKTGSYEEFLQYPSFNWIMTHLLDDTWEKTAKAYENLFKEGGSQKDYLLDIQNKVFDGMSGDKVFGELGFARQVNNAIQLVQNKENFSAKELKQYKIDRFVSLVDLFTKASDIQKSVMLPMLNRDYWEQVLGVDLKGIAGGFNMPSKDNTSPYGEMFKWNAQKGYYEYDGLPSLPGYDGGTWMYKTDNQETGVNQKQAVSNIADLIKQENPVPQDSTLMNVAREFTNTSAMLANANVVPWREAVDRISYKAPWEPVTREEVDRATTEPLYAAFAPSYTPFMPPLSQPAASNEAFRPAERQQVAMVARPVVININAERLVDFGTLNIDNATDDEEIAQKVRNALEGILAEVAESTGGNYNYGVSA